MPATRFILPVLKDGAPVLDAEGVATKEHWDYDGSKLGFKEAVALEKFTGMTLTDLEARANKGSVEALGAMLWMAQRRSGSSVKWSDFDFDLPSLETAEVDDEGNVIAEPDPSPEAPAAT